MIFKEVIYLCKVIWEKDENLSDIQTLIKRKVYAQMQNVRAREFYSASLTNLKPSMEFVIRKSEYNGERIIEYKGKEYSVIRGQFKGLNDYLLVCSDGRSTTN